MLMIHFFASQSRLPKVDMMTSSKRNTQEFDLLARDHKVLSRVYQEAAAEIDPFRNPRGPGDLGKLRANPLPTVSLFMSTCWNVFQTGRGNGTYQVLL